MPDSIEAPIEASTQSSVQTTAVEPIAIVQPVAAVAAVAAPAVPVLPVAPVVVPTPAAASAPARIDMTSDQLKARLDEERTKAAAKAEEKILKDLGMPLDQAKELIAEKQKLEEEKLSELQRRDKAIDDLRPRAARADILEATVKRQAEAALASLTDAQRAAVLTLAGDDPVRTWSTLEALRPTWATPAPQTPPPLAVAPAPIQTQPVAPAATQTPAIAASAAAPAPTLLAPASTASTSSTPASTVPTTPDILQVYQDMRGVNPIAAAAFRSANWRAIGEAEQKARGATN